MMIWCSIIQYHALNNIWKTLMLNQMNGATIQKRNAKEFGYTHE